MADTKITALTALTSVDDGDVLAIVDDPAGTPVTKKITKANLVSAIPAANITSGTLPDARMPALTGDVTSSSGTVATTIAAGAVTLAKMANMATASLIYRKTAGTGAPEVNTLATLKTDLGLTGTNSGDQTSIVGITGTKAQFDTAVTDGNILYVGDVVGVTDGDKGDITVSASGATWTIDAGAVTLAKQADMATASLVYRKTAGSGAPEVQTLATLKTDLGLTGTNSGDQTSIVGITGTKAQFDTAVTDGNILFVGDVTQYTDEMAQDAVGGILTDSAEIDFTYNDAGNTITASIVASSIDETKLDASVNASLDLADSALQAANISDTAYAGTWDAVTTIAPSKNAVYDKINSMFTGTANITVGTTAPGSPATGDLWVDTN